MNKRLATCLTIALSAIIPAKTAVAENITFSVIGPHEYELPVNFKDFDAFVQYGFTNNTSQVYDAKGNLGPMAHQNFTLGLTKVVRFITFDSLPNVGFAPEAIIPEVGVRSGNNSAVYGIADPVFGGAVWVKPNKDSTFGFQTFITAPIGSKQYTSNNYSNITTILYDYQAKWWDLTGQTGGVFRSDTRAPGKDRMESATTFFTSMRLGYKLNQPSIPLEPFFAVDYEFNTGTKDLVTNTPNLNSNTADLALGAGAVITMSDKYNLTLRYSRSVYGLNEPPTNAVYLKFVSILP